MKYFALIGVTMAADELLSGAVDCIAGSQTGKQYASTTGCDESDLESATTWVDLEIGKVDSGYYGNGLDAKCHKLGVIKQGTSTGSNAGVQDSVIPWDTCIKYNGYTHVKFYTSATYGGDDKAEPCDWPGDALAAIYTDSGCTSMNEAKTGEYNLVERVNGDSAWYNNFCNAERAKQVTDGGSFEVKWGECTSIPGEDPPQWVILLGAANQPVVSAEDAEGADADKKGANGLVQVAASAMAAAAMYLY